MLASVRALLTGIIDYAGLFPPAKLPLDQSIRNYLRQRAGPDSWMLGRFVCPVARLAELEPFLAEAGSPIKISALGAGGNTADDFNKAMAADWKTIVEVQKRGQANVMVDTFEVRLQTSLLDPSHMEGDECAESEDILGRVALTIAAPRELEIYFELATASDWKNRLAELIRAAKTMPLWFECEAGEDRPPRPMVGIKLRCGGLEPAAIPTSEKVAHFIHCCCDEGVRLKLTAGLHHPFRHFDESLQTQAHGFLNVFTAGVLTHSEGIHEKHIRAILADENPAHFVFTEDGLEWQGFKAGSARIEKARREFITSFGSCSFEEPCDDLRSLGLLP